jgi:TDG/mug DNA glycosylase family protein
VPDTHDTGRQGVRSKGFPAVATRESRVLVLGTLPGPESLRQQQYYAQPRNAFWRIMGDLFGAGPDEPYERRMKILKENRVALWDVCASANRKGALDAAIRPTSIVVNDFTQFFRTHRQVQLICCNGQKAAQLYRRKVQPTLPEKWRSLQPAVLPSTSPAYAAMSYAEKLKRWEIVRREAGR